jgi:hypothetical protein
VNPRLNHPRPRPSHRGRHRRTRRTCYPPFALTLTRLWRARQLASRDLPYRPARQITLEVRRREDARLRGGQRV